MSAEDHIALRMRIPGDETRSAEQLLRHYEVEKELATRLRSASKRDRLDLYRSVYDELFRRVPDHPQVTAPKRASHQNKVSSQFHLVKPLLTPGGTFMEIGGGDCALSFEVAPLVKQAWGVEVTDQLIPRPAPPNFQEVLSNGSSIPLPSDTVDLAFSFSVAEHVHPEDFIEHLAEVHRVLKPGGVYYCVTPNRVLGPHDISRYFDDVAAGLHLKEYTNGEMARLYRRAGFGAVWVEKRLKSIRWRMPVWALQMAEGICGVLPRGIRTRLASSRRLSWAMEVSVAGRKPR
jgi:SAM-dependent methyltransferase